MGQQAVVTITRGADRVSSAREAMADQLAQVVRTGDRVLLKVNQVAGFPAENGSTVAPDLIGAVAEMVLDAGAARVGIAEDVGRNHDTLEVFRAMGTIDVAQRVGADVIDLRRCAYRRMPVSGALVAEEIEYSVPLLECDRVIGVTKLKTHHQAGITAAMKNMFGAISDDYKRRFHRSDLGAALVDINSIRSADFTVVDGFPAMEGIGPHLGHRVPINITISGSDAVAVDAVCAEVMGFGADWPRSVTLAKKKGLGVADLARIQVCGLPISAVRRRFQSPLEHFQEKLAGHVEIVAGPSCSGCSCAVGTVFMLLLGRHEKDMADFDGVRVYLGKQDEVPDLDEERVFVVGNCADGMRPSGWSASDGADRKGHPHAITGCPPSITEIMDMISAADVGLTAFGSDVR